MLPRLAVVGLIAACLAGAAVASPSGRREDPIKWRQSRSLGKPWAGRLVNGVQLPEDGEYYFTWDPVLKTSPNRPWRRWGSDRLLRTIFTALDEYFTRNPESPRIGIGDLSRPQGGNFGRRYGGRGHASHQNGLDVDVYYPRVDGQELRAGSPAEVDRTLAQELVDAFVRAGAVKVFVGPRVGLRGPRRIVSALVYHDDHLHARIGPDPAPTHLGRSVRGRSIDAVRIGRPTGRRVLVFGCIHGDECAGIAVTRRLEREVTSADLWLVHDLNPDGHALGRRQNARGVDLNRNFASEWRPNGRAWSAEYPGRRPFSEPETRVARRLILSVRPEVTIWFHQPQAMIRAWGPSIPAAQRYAAVSGLPFRPIRWPAGTGANWQNHRFPGKPSFVVELPPGPLGAAAAARHVRAVLALAE